jgi:hypothetical protein
VRYLRLDPQLLSNSPREADIEIFRGGRPVFVDFLMKPSIREECVPKPQKSTYSAVRAYLRGASRDPYMQDAHHPERAESRHDSSMPIGQRVDFTGQSPHRERGLLREFVRTFVGAAKLS